MTVRKSATDNGFIIFKDQLSLLNLVPDEQLGRSIKLLLENFDELPQQNDLVYEMFATNVRRYREQSAKSRESGLRGGNPTLMGRDNPTVKLQNKTIQDKNIQKKENILKEKRPTLQEVKDYCLERNNSIDAEKWYDFYSAKGWKIGKEPMKDWKAAVRTWERKQTPQKKEPTVLIADGQFFIDDSMQEYADIVKTMTDYDVERCWKWIHDNFYGQEKPISWVRDRLQQFRKGE